MYKQLFSDFLLVLVTDIEKKIKIIHTRWSKLKFSKKMFSDLFIF